MLTSRILHVLREPFHTCSVPAVYARCLLKIHNRELRASSIILNPDHDKQLEQNVDVAATLNNNKLNTNNSNRELKSIKTHSHMTIEENTRHQVPKCISVFVKYYKKVSLCLDMHCPYVITFSENTEGDNKALQHVCTLQINWPAKMTFKGVDNTQLNAQSQAVFKCLQWLRQENRIVNGAPKFYGKHDTMKMLMRPIKVNIDKIMLSEIEQLVDRFDNELKDIITFELHSSKDLNLYDKIDIIDEVFKSNMKISRMRNFRPLLTSTQTDYINSCLLENLCNRLTEQNHLPIHNYKNEILEKIETEQVVLIRGHTGCGKSTQVPQFIMDSFIERLQGTSCHIIISQPRRIAAVSLAHRVATERNVVLGDTVGYEVRLDEVQLKRNYGMLFCTSGILLKNIIKNSNMLGITHVIVDEIHQRSADVDLTLFLLKTALAQNPSLKLILMSASVESNVLQEYFNCSVIDVPGIIHPVEINFLDDIAKISDVFRYHVRNRYAETQVRMIADLIRWIDQNQPPGAILCFLPGWSEICALNNFLKQDAVPHYYILSLHSMLPSNLQYKVFEEVPEDVRKIILSTDIAETSITIPDVVYVIDSCISKLQYIVDDANLSGTRTEYISQSSVQQRKGRAGRVKPGVSYHLVTKKQYDSLQVSTVPEILRVPLDFYVLRAKEFSNLPATEFFKQLLSPPDEKVVKHAVNQLINVGAIDENENLTPLGTRLLNLSISPALGKALMYSVIFECTSPMLVLTTHRTVDDLFTSYKTGKTEIRKLKRKQHPYSDHIATYKILKKYLNYFEASQMDDAVDYCSFVHLSPDRMEEFYMIINLHLLELKKSRIIEKDTDIKDTFTDCEELWCGLILATTNIIAVYLQHHPSFKGQAFMVTSNCEPALVASISLCFKRKEFPSPYLTSFEHVHSSNRDCALMIDVSVLAPLTVLLFYNGSLVRSKEEKHRSVFSRGNVVLRDGENGVINMEMEPREADVVLRLRDAIRQILDYYIHVQGHEMMTVNKNVADFKQDMLCLLRKLLDKASADVREKRHV